MTIIEKRIVLNTKDNEISSVLRIENAISEAGLEPVRWAIVDVVENDYIILANGVEKQSD